MAFALKKLLRPHQIKHQFNLLNFKLISQSRQHYYSKFEPLKTLTKIFQQHLTRKLPAKCSCTVPRSYCPHKGVKLNIGRIFGVSAICGSIFFRPYIMRAMDGRGILLDDHSSMFDSSEGEEKLPAIWIFVRRFWLPVFFFFTILTNWDHPVFLATKVVIFLLSTKPTPLSVYILVEQFCREYMRQEPHFYRLKSLYANKVEVEDYKLLCLARVEIRGEKFTLVGILGGWWILPLSSGLFPTLGNYSSDNLLIK